MCQIPAKKIIYDFGSNNGDDIPYYLKKSDLVIAVEANPRLIEEIKVRFSNEIDGGKLVIESCVLSADGDSSSVSFYIHKKDHALSQFPMPENLFEYDEVALPSANVVDLVRRHGDPFYIKIDIEYYDTAILRSLFDNNIRPPFISAESQSVEVFSLLLSLGGYKTFNLVDGASVGRKYENRHIKTNHGEEVYSFPWHSAGPFGEDILDPWMTPDNFFRRLAFEGLGWKDIHATTELTAAPMARPRLRQYLIGGIKHKFMFG